jgi:chromosome segregation ATPase
LRAGLQSRDATISELRCAVDEGQAELEATSALAATTLEAHAQVESRLRELKESSARLGARVNQAEEESARLRSLKAEAEEEAASAQALTTEARHELAAARNELGARLLRMQQEINEAEEGWRRAAADEEKQLEVRTGAHPCLQLECGSYWLFAHRLAHTHAACGSHRRRCPAILQRAPGRERKRVRTVGAAMLPA